MTLELGVVLVIVQGAASFAGAWAAMRLELREVRREVTRAHKRLDLIGAPSVTLERAE